MKLCQQSCRCRRRARIGKGVSRQRTGRWTVRESMIQSRHLVPPSWERAEVPKKMVEEGCKPCHGRRRKGMYHYKVCKAIRIDVCLYSHIYVYTTIQEYTYMTIWKYRNAAIKICRYIERRESILHPTMWAVSVSLCPSAFGSFFLQRAGR